MKLHWKELIEILMESPLYFTMTIKERYIYLNWFAETYCPFNC